VSIKNDGHYFCRAGGNRPDGLNEPVTNLFRDEVVKAMAKWRFEKNRPCQGVKRQFIFTPSRP
ncbi:hypothetical protein NLN00_26085, partial [Escherichia coli]|nr:hypothetical protein [Escherichia coli]